MKEITRDKNQRITKQRQFILDELRSVCSHPTAQQIYQMTLKKLPNVGLATIYRTLDFLEEKGLIIKMQTKDKVARYDGNAESHLHLVCKRCGTVVDIFDAKSIKINSPELKKSGFKIKNDFLEIPGLCEKCK